MRPQAVFGPRSVLKREEKIHMSRELRKAKISVQKEKDKEEENTV